MSDFEEFKNRTLRELIEHWKSKPQREMENKLITDIFEKQQARIEELEKEREWQLIETAPKDGTQILLGCFNEANNWCVSSEWRDSFWFNCKDCKTMTHWQPLPQPPIKE